MTNGTARVTLVLAFVLIAGTCSGGSDDQVGAPAGSERFSDPQGSYDMAIDPDWTARHGILTADTETWVASTSCAQWCATFPWTPSTRTSSAA